MELFNDLKDESKGVVIHHWDTDGLVSAALLLNYFAEHYPTKELHTFVPTITNYYLTADQYNFFQKQSYNFALTCDINFHEDTVNKLAKHFPGQVYMFDHHHQQPYKNVHYYNEPSPACASYISDQLGLPNNLQAVIAMVGDKEEAIQSDKIHYPKVEAMMTEHGVSFSQLLEMRRLIDSNYIVDDYEGMQETIHLLRYDPLAILTDVRLLDNISKIDTTLHTYLEQQPEKLTDLVYYMEIDNSYNLLSQLTRALSRKYSNKIIFTRQYKNEQYNCYIRRRDFDYDMRDMITYARSLGLNAGGKDDVVGMIIPRPRLEECFPKIQKKLLSLQ